MNCYHNECFALRSATIYRTDEDPIVFVLFFLLKDEFASQMFSPKTPIAIETKHAQTVDLNFMNKQNLS